MFQSSFLKLSIFLLVFALFSCKPPQEFPNKNPTTIFPSEKVDDYNPKFFHVRSAFPVNNDSVRIWVKGNAGGKVVEANGIRRELKPPYFTETIQVLNAISVNVKFLDSVNNVLYTQEVFPKKKAFYEAEPDSFSWVLFGCFQPFSVEKMGTPTSLGSSIVSDFNHRNFNMRKEFAKAALGHNSMVPNTTLLLGTGDQVYTDPGYKEDNYDFHPLSAWQHMRAKPILLIEEEEYIPHMNRVYNHNYSFGLLDSAHAHLPAINVWDDHEITDGWGSHGHEYIKGKLNDSLKHAYLQSRLAFKNHQFLTGPAGERLKNDTSLHNFQFDSKVNGVPIFCFDLKSEKTKKGGMMKPAQIDSFKSWISSIDSGEYAVIVSSVPFIHDQVKFGKVLAILSNKDGGRDDVADKWSYSKNKKQVKEIFKIIKEARLNGIKPIIVSGDAHASSLHKVILKNSNKTVLCYEIVSSGLTHEKMVQDEDIKTAYGRYKRWASAYKPIKGIKVCNEHLELTLNFATLTFSKADLKLNIFFQDEETKMNRSESFSLDFKNGEKK